MTFPSQAVSARIGDELRLQAVAAADHLDPSGPAPIVLAWHERTTVSVAESQYLITVSYAGGPPPDGVDAILTADLRRRWIGDRASRERPWSISVVVAAFQSTRPRRGLLTLALTATPRRPGALLDDLRFGRDLREAIDRRQSDLWAQLR